MLRASKILNAKEAFHRNNNPNAGFTWVWSQLCLQFGRVRGDKLDLLLDWMHCFTVSPTGGSIYMYNTMCVEKPLCELRGLNEDNVP